MKKSFQRHITLLCLHVTVFVNKILIAQENYMYTEITDSIVAPFDKSLITTNILYDRAFPLGRFDLYNTATDTVDYEFAIQAYHELYQASYRRSRMTAPAVLNNMIEWENLRARVPIMILDYLYNKMDTLAMQDGLFTYQNGMLYDVPGRSCNPYYLQHLQIAAPLIEEVKGTSIMFVLMPHFISCNTGLNVQQVSFNFGSGLQILNGPLDSLTINFSKTGTKNFTINVTLSNGSSFTTRCRMLVGGDNVAARTTGEYDPCRTEFLQSDYAFQGYDELQTFNGMFEINYYYRSSASCSGSAIQMQKPVIMIDGFDPTDKRTAKALGEQFLFYYDDVNFPSHPERINIIKEMQDLGYDVIIVNIPTYFHTYGGQIIPLDSNANNPPPGYTYNMGKIIRGGGDYVERNALTLATLINRINQQLTTQGSTEQLVLIGPSMGGQISRYALQWMEDRGINHNVRLWVSFDSNHEGTVLPIGEQFIIKRMAGLTNEANKSLDRQLNSPHARQSLVDHHLYHVNGQTNAGGAPGFHTRYYNSIDSLGWPQQCRKIAMVSGAENGSELPVPHAGELAMKIKIKARKTGRLVLFFLCNLCIIGDPILLETSMFTAPAPNQYGKVSEFNFPIINNYKSLYATGSTLTRTQSIETVQGGFYWGYKELIGKTGSGFVSRLINTQIQISSGYHAHQPTANTLAFGKGTIGTVYNFKWDDDVSGYNLACNGYIPFDYYLGPKTFSLKHDSLFYNQARILIEEIQGILHDNRIPINASITRCPGTLCFLPYLCAGETDTFTISNPQPNMVYTWSVSDPAVLQIISGQGTSSVIIQNIDNGNASAFYNISCSALSNCFRLIVPDYTIWTGKPILTGTYKPSPGSQPQTLIGGPIPKFLPFNEVCPGGVITANMSVNPNIFPNIVWELVQSSSPVTWWEENNNLNFILSSAGDYAVFKASAHTPCGLTEIFYKFLAVASGSCPFFQLQKNPAHSFSFSPNPTDGKVNVVLKNNNTKLPGSIRELRVLDYSGSLKLLKLYPVYTKTVSVDISGLATGVYFLLVYDGKTWTTEKIIKK